MAFVTLSQNEQDDILVRTFKAQETDLFTHQTNKTRLEDMLLILAPGPFRESIVNLLSQTDARISEVQAIVDSTAKQLPDAARIAAALSRI